MARKSREELNRIYTDLKAQGAGGAADAELLAYEQQLSAERDQALAGLSGQVTYNSPKAKDGTLTADDIIEEAAWNRNVMDVDVELRNVCGAFRVQSETTGLPTYPVVLPQSAIV